LFTFALMKILLIRFSSIGDIVLTTPVIRCLKKQLPGVELHFLLKKSFATVIEHNPYVNKKIFFEKTHTEVLEKLAEENYDLIIDLQKNLRSFRIKQVLGIKSLSFNKLNIEKYLFINLKLKLLPKVHIVDRYMKAVRSLGVENDGAGLDYFISESDEQVLNLIPETHNKNYIAWVIGAKHFTKRLPIEKMISIAEKIKSPVILLGDKDDHATGEKLFGEIGSNIFNACGMFSLNQSAALIKHSKKVITHDTGLMHIAAAFKKDIISIWGNTVPEFGMYPYFGNEQKENSVILEVKGLSCRPCSKIGFEKCPKGHFKCMREIDENFFDS
jgi:ADP-heptose:LPS heptosyltransferase